VYQDGTDMAVTVEQSGSDNRSDVVQGPGIFNTTAT